MVSRAFAFSTPAISSYCFVPSNAPLSALISKSISFHGSDNILYLLSIAYALPLSSFIFILPLFSYQELFSYYHILFLKVSDKPFFSSSLPLTQQKMLT